MTVRERLLAAVEALPPEASVTIPVAVLREWIYEDGPAPSRTERDMTVEEVAEEVGRAVSTVRGWLHDGALKGYKLNGRDWRVTRSALRAYLDAQARGGDDDEGFANAEEVDISAWRQVYRGEDA